MDAGAAGVSIGRNIFQHENPRLITYVINQLVHGKWTLTKCMEALSSERAASGVSLYKIRLQ
jgi:hypothetical protein